MGHNLGHYNREFFSEIVKKSNNLSDICRNLNISTTSGNREVVKRYIKEYNLDTNHFKVVRNKYGSRKKLCEILIENSTYKNNYSLKKKLYEGGLKEKKCEMCGLGDIWMDKEISLILDHINGVNNDNRLNNLRIVCPNCNATLDTHGGKNIGNKYKYPKNIKKCGCGNKITNKAKECIECSLKSRRKVKNRPDLETLLKEVKESGYSEIGRKYGVSDNSIRKWIKHYKK